MCFPPPAGVALAGRLHPGTLLVLTAALYTTSSPHAKRPRRSRPAQAAALGCLAIQVLPATCPDQIFNELGKLIRYFVLCVWDSTAGTVAHSKASACVTLASSAQGVTRHAELTR